jgi:hypothetical protein
MKYPIILLSFFVCLISRADIFCDDSEQSASIQFTDTEVAIRISKWASPDSIAAKLSKKPGRAKALFTMAFTRKTGPSVARAREACVVGKGNPLLLSCQFLESSPVKVKLSIEGSDESQTFDISRADFRSAVESNRFVGAQGVTQEEKVSFTGIMYGPGLTSGTTLSIEFQGKDCGPAPRIAR